MGQAVARHPSPRHDVSGDHLEILEIPKPRREDRPADPRQPIREAVEAERAVDEELTHDHETPAVAEVLDGFREGAIIAA